MKKSLLLLILFLGLNYIGAQESDLIILMDTSESMFTHYDEVNNFLISNLLTKHMKKGDQFHLIAFNSSVDLEIAEYLESRESFSKIMGRLLLLQPLGKYTDLLSALDFLHDYAGKLSEDRPKTILILTDGIHDPPPSSPYQYSSVNIEEELQKKADQLNQEGWDVNLVRVSEEDTNGEETVIERDSTFDTIADISTDTPLSAEESSRGEEKTETSEQTGLLTDKGTDKESMSADSKEENNLDLDKTSIDILNQTSSSLNQSSEVNGIDKSPKDMYEELAEGLNTDVVDFTADENAVISALGKPLLKIQSNLNNIGHRFKLPISLTNSTSQTVLVRIRQIWIDGNALLPTQLSLEVKPQSTITEKIALQLPEEWEIGSYNKTIRFQFAKGFDAGPEEFPLYFNLKKSGIRFNWLLLLLGVITGFLLFASLFILARNIVRNIRIRPKKLKRVVHKEQKEIEKVEKNKQKHPESNTIARPMLTEAEQAHHLHAITIQRETPYKPTVQKNFKDLGITVTSLRMRVFLEGGLVEQNHHLGQFNIQNLENPKTVGGKNSHFKIFISPISGKIGTIVFDGTRFDFIPKDKRVLTSQKKITDCIGKEILILSDIDQHVSIYFEPYISPLDEINAILSMK